MFKGRLFGSRRRQTRSQLIRQEFGAGVGHLRQAAAQVAQGLGETVRRSNLGPSGIRRTAYRGMGSMGSAVAVFAPLAAAARDRMGQARMAPGGKPGGRATKRRDPVRAKSARQAPRSGRRGSRLLGLALLGTAVGTAAMVARRRRQRWGEFDMDEPFDAPETTVAGPFERTIPGPVAPDGDAASPAERVSSAVQVSGIAPEGAGGDPTATAMARDKAATESGKRAAGQGATATRKPTTRTPAADHAD